MKNFVLRTFVIVASALLLVGCNGQGGRAAMKAAEEVCDVDIQSDGRESSVQQQEENIQERIIDLEHQRHYSVHQRNGLWGLYYWHDQVVPCRYVDYEELEGVVAFKREDGRYVFYRGDESVFSHPADSYEMKSYDYGYGEDSSVRDYYLVARSGSDYMVYNFAHSMAPLKAYKQIESMLFCHYRDDSFVIASMNGLDYKDGLRHPRLLRCTSTGEEKVVCKMADGNEHTFRFDDGWECEEFTPSQWEAALREYLTATGKTDPVFGPIYEHDPDTNNIFYWTLDYK